MALQIRFKKPPVTPCAPFSGSRMMPPKAAAAYINVSIDVMYAMIHERKIPYIQKGTGKRAVYSIDRCDLDVWIERTRQASTLQLESWYR
jgi:excisionase family DNA binding protein